MCGARTKTSGAARKWGEKAGGAPRRTLCPNTHAAPPARPGPTSPSQVVTSSVLRQNSLAGLACYHQARHNAQGTPSNRRLLVACRMQRCGLLFSGALPYVATPAGALPAQICSWLAAPAQAGPTAVPPAPPLPRDPCSCMVHTGCCSTTLAYPEQQPRTRFQAVQQHLAVRDFWLHMHGPLGEHVARCACIMSASPLEQRGSRAKEQQPPANIGASQGGSRWMQYHPQFAVRNPAAYTADGATCQTENCACATMRTGAWPPGP